MVTQRIKQGTQRIKHADEHWGTCICEILTFCFCFGRIISFFVYEEEFFLMAVV
jgi:hypothetical protein